MLIRKIVLIALLLSPFPSVSADCVVCTDVPTAGMFSKGKPCTKDRVGKGNKCIDNENWVENAYCQLSCFEAGRGYEDVVCCDPSTAVPPPSPTAAPTPPVGTPPPGDDFTERGEWGDVFDMNLISIHNMLLPDGRVLSYGTDKQGNQGGDLYYEVWDMSHGVHEGHKLLQHRTDTDIFCSSLNVDTSTGNLIIMGGDGRNIGSKGAGINTALEYVVETEEVRFHPLGSMKYGRWYGTSINLPNGDIFVIGGRDEDYLGSDIPELWSPGSGFRELPGASVPAIADNREKNYWYYPHTYVNSSGEIVVFMPRKQEEIYLVSVEGIGSIEQIGRRPFESHPRTPSIMFRQDQVAFLDDEGNFWVVDISNTSDVNWSKRANIGTARTNGNLVMLPDGKVFIVGGCNDIKESKGTIKDAVLEIQVWNPETNEVKSGPPQEKPRLYHSSSQILTDGCVMSAGGGSPGPITNLNGQLYCPYDSDRLVIDSCPKNINSDDKFTIEVDDSSRVLKVTATKVGMSSHTRNCDTRWLDLEFDVLDDKTLEVQAEEENVMIGGVWMVNLIDSDGVASEASIVGVNMAPLALTS